MNLVPISLQQKWLGCAPILFVVSCLYSLFIFSPSVWLSFLSNSICTKHMTAPIVCQFKMAQRDESKSILECSSMNNNTNQIYMAAMEGALSGSRSSSKNKKTSHSDIVKSLNRHKAFMCFALFDFFTRTSFTRSLAWLACLAGWSMSVEDNFNSVVHCSVNILY